MAKFRARQTISLALEHEMTADPRVVLMGEDVAAAGGVFKTTDGLLAKFGAERVRDTPISEMGFLGAAVGAAMTGLRPVVEIMFMDFLGVALDQLVTQAAKMHFLSGGQFRVPLVVRGSAGAGMGYAAQHSQSVEPWLLSTPGLVILIPSGPGAAYGLLRAAIRHDDPVVVIEPRSVYAVRDEVDFDDWSDYRIGTARVVKSGTDVTILAAGAAVGRAVEAADRADFSAEVIDLLSLQPWDVELITASVRRTGRLVVVEDGPYQGGWGAGIAAETAGRLFGELRSPILRITYPDVPVPYAENLEAQMIPSPDVIVDQVSTLIATAVLPQRWWTHA